MSPGTIITILNSKKTSKTEERIFSLFADLYFSQYLKTLETYPYGIMAVDSKGYIRFMNRMAGYFWGIQPSAVLGKPVKEVCPSSLLIKGLSEGICVLDKRILVNDRVLKCTVQPSTIQGRLLGVMEILSDYGELYSLEQKIGDLKKKNEMLDALMSQLFEESIVINMEGDVIYLSPKTAQNMGIGGGEIQGLNASNLDIGPSWKQVASSGVPSMIRVSRPNKKPMTVIESPLHKNGDMVGIVHLSIFPELNMLKEPSKGSRNATIPSFRRSECKFSVNDIVGKSEAITKIKKDAMRIAEGNSTVLIVGETGTGKELFAQAIHNAGRRKKGPFVRINCAGIPESLLEADLFGYEPGSFTGAQKGGKPGKFELAHHGTLFLDEASEMSLSMQAKLLSGVQDGMIFERVGGTAYYEVDVRIIAATNKDLSELVRKGRFREDLYYRFDVITLEIPPLRERMDDIPLLAEHFISIMNRTLNSEIEDIDPKLMDILKTYNWPGNVRELRNILEAATNFSDGKILTINSLPIRIRKKILAKCGSNPPKAQGQSYFPTASDGTEKDLIIEALKAKKGNKRQAASYINMPRSTFYTKLKRYQINTSEFSFLRTL